MTKEEEKLLLIDLCSRIPYGVRVKFTEFSSLKDKELIGVNVYDNDMPIVTCRTENGIITMPLKYVKPYLYPLSSMTGKHRAELFNIRMPIEDNFQDTLCEIDFYHRYHFDYRGLIPMGLADDATNLNIY